MEDIFGQPENAAERYLYHSAKQVLNNNGNLLVSRLPYGNEEGVGFSNSYSALIYPIHAQVSTLVADLSTNDNGTLALSAGYPVFLGTYSTVYTGFAYTSSGGNVVFNNTIISAVLGTVTVIPDAEASLSRVT